MTQGMLNLFRSQKKAEPVISLKIADSASLLFILFIVLLFSAVYFCCLFLLLILLFILKNLNQIIDIQIISD